jgi:DNA-binding NtrC family response regulator
MPARIVVVHDDPNFRDFLVTELQAAGYDIKAFAGSMAAVEALEAAELIELLITRVRFPEGTPHGVALASMALLKKPGMRVLFVARDENREHTNGIGEFLSVPVTGPEIVATVTRMLAAATDR